MTRPGSLPVAVPWSTFESDCVRCLLRAGGLIVEERVGPRTVVAVLALSRRAACPSIDLSDIDIRPGLALILLATSVDPWTVALSRSLGATYLSSWDAPPASLIKLVRSVAQGDSSPQPYAGGERDRFHDLTHREREVMAFVALGTHDNEIASRLTISAHTVRTHVDNSLAKLGAPHRHAAAAMARTSPSMTARLADLRLLSCIETAGVE